MRDPNRIDHVLNIIKNAWKTYPDLRLGQLLVNAALLEEEGETEFQWRSRLFYIEDDEFAESIRAWASGEHL